MGRGRAGGRPGGWVSPSPSATPTAERGGQGMQPCRLLLLSCLPPPPSLGDPCMCERVSLGIGHPAAPPSSLGLCLAGALTVRRGGAVRVRKGGLPDPGGPGLAQERLGTGHGPLQGRHGGGGAAPLPLPQAARAPALPLARATPAAAAAPSASRLASSSSSSSRGFPRFLQQQRARHGIRERRTSSSGRSTAHTGVVSAPACFLSERPRRLLARRRGRWRRSRSALNALWERKGPARGEWIGWRDAAPALQAGERRMRRPVATCRASSLPGKGYPQQRWHNMRSVDR